MSALKRLRAIAGAVALVLCMNGAWAGSSTTGDANSGYSASGLFNLGNAAARNGQTGVAVLDYERAHLLAPHDDDIRHNLRWIRDRAGLHSEADGWWQRAASLVAPDTMYVIGCLGVLLTGAGALSGRLDRKRRWWPRTLLTLGLLSVGLSAFSAAAVWPTMHEAVVVAKPLQIRAAPTELGDALWTLPEGSVIATGAGTQDFVIVQADHGQTGWAARRDLAAVVPRA